MNAQINMQKRNITEYTELDDTRSNISRASRTPISLEERSDYYRKLRQTLPYTPLRQQDNYEKEFNKINQSLTQKLQQYHHQNNQILNTHKRDYDNVWETNVNLSRSRVISVPDSPLKTSRSRSVVSGGGDQLSRLRTPGFSRGRCSSRYQNNRETVSPVEEALRTKSSVNFLDLFDHQEYNENSSINPSVADGSRSIGTADGGSIDQSSQRKLEYLRSERLKLQKQKRMYEENFQTIYCYPDNDIDISPYEDSQTLQKIYNRWGQQAEHTWLTFQGFMMKKYEQLKRNINYSEGKYKNEYAKTDQLFSLTYSQFNTATQFQSNQLISPDLNY